MSEAFIVCHQLVQHLALGLELSISDLSIHRGERLAIIGPNGVGKSTFLRLLCGVEAPDSGSVVCRQGVTRAFVEQEREFESGKSAHEIVIEDLKRASIKGDLDLNAEIALGKTGFTDVTREPATLSGGWKKRLALASGLAMDADVLVLDEPTNHLDFEGFEWLERFLLRTKPTLVCVTHDRRFLDTVPTRILDMDRQYPGGFLLVEGTYSDYLRRREEVLSAQIQKQKSLSSTWRREKEWLSRQPKARTTKSESRVKKAKDLEKELQVVSSKVRGRRVDSALRFSDSGRKSKKLMELEGASKSLGGKLLFKGLDLILSPKMRLGILGPNGAGKTTLLKALSEHLELDGGKRTPADGLKVIMFDQQRAQLDPEMTLQDSLSPTGDTVLYQGQRMHVKVWAEKFLFDAKFLRRPVGQLSGGEQARVLIARLMLEEADILLLDEPTNDLDIPTLELLEMSLLDFPGAVVLVTHDRYLMDTVCDELLALDGKGAVQSYASFDQWWDRHTEKEKKKDKPAKPKKESREKKATLTSQERKEWSAMERTVQKAEELVEKLKQKVEQPEIAADLAKMQKACHDLQNAQDEVERLYARWEELELKRGGG